MAKAPAWEALLARGKAEEKRGRLDEAEAAYRRSLAANPGFASLHREFARFLDGCGRLGESAKHLARAVELGWPRDEAHAALSRLLAKRGGSEGSSAVEVHSFLDQGRFEKAAEALRDAADRSPEEGEALWPDVFSALLCARRYRAAFALGEEMLERSPRIPFANGFLWPWWHRVSSRGSEKKMRFCARELSRLEGSGTEGDFPVWYAYCRGVLLLGLGRGAQAMAEYARVRRARSPRYSMMHHAFVMHRLLAGELQWTIVNCRALLRRVPDYWWFHCRMAEALMAAGRADHGLREFERAFAAAADVRAQRAVTTWHGAALLWAGRYRAALKKLDEGAAIGAKIWVNCWRGAARLKLGDARGALSDLDAAIEADPEDLEAYLWRGEAHRLAGRPAQALRDLDRALALDPKYAWAYVNRALARGALGDEEGFAADFARVPSDILAAARGPKGKRALLEAALARAKGVRRPERYLDALWMRRSRG